jgi:hypothetical protein
MSNEIDRLMTTLRIRIPGSIDAALQDELFVVLEEFLNETNVWREAVELATIAGEVRYDLLAPVAGTINRLLSVVTQDGRAIRATMPVPGELVLASDVGASQLIANVAMTISGYGDRDGYPYVPEWIWSRYGTDFIDGVQARMFSQIAKPYSNERVAIYHMRKFNDAMARARVEAAHENTFGVQRWRFPQSFAVRRR